MDNISDKPGYNVSYTDSSGNCRQPDTIQRVEIITGVGRRRRWTSEEKARIVSETLAPGINVSEIARGYGLYASQLFSWRRQFRTEEKRDDQTQSFAPVVVFDDLRSETANKAGTIEVAIGDVVVRVGGQVDVVNLRHVLDAVRRLK
ncbi:transposase [Azospirillaceae bacterium]